MTIAGSDSAGGAGVQADLKTFQAFEVYGAAVITAVTAQDTLAVHDVWTPPVDAVIAQIDAVITDIGADAVKTGMLVSAEVVTAVAEAARRLPLANLVVDPVLAASTGEALLEASAVETLLEELFPLAVCVTPNLAEAGALLGCTVASTDEMEEAARQLCARGAVAAVTRGEGTEFSTSCAGSFRTLHRRVARNRA